MPQLIQIRQRIKAVSTIKKITSAMRLISRSFHARMYREQVHYKEYQTALNKLMVNVLSRIPNEAKLHFFRTVPTIEKQLFIIIGSQKGLCGSFNNPLTYWIDNHKELLTKKSSHVVSISKRVTEYLHKIGIRNLITLPELKLTSIESLTQKLLTFVDSDEPYSQVTILSSSPRSLFSQEFKECKLFPLALPSTFTVEQAGYDYSWNHDPEAILKVLIKIHLTEQLRSSLFMSLLAEHNARFAAMDNATGNAENFLNTMKIQFNKMRQAKITKELTELAGAFEIQSLI